MADTDTDKVDDKVDDTATDDKVDAAEVEKWRALARKHEARAKDNAEAAKRLAAIEDESKSELERAVARAEAAEARVTKAEGKALKYEVAAAKGVPTKLIRFLTGDTEDELNTAADELLAAVKPDTGSDDGNGSDDDTTDAPEGGALSSRPQERLRAGAANDAEPDETDPAKLVADIPRA